MVITRSFARASHATFTIPPIRDFVLRHIGDGIGWADPFAGDFLIPEFTNDHNPKAKAQQHQEAEEWVKTLRSVLNGAVFDPPYSYRQVTEHYQKLGKRATALDTSYNFYARVMNPLAARIRLGGKALSFGWNSNGFGKIRGFEIEEILLVAHGLHHNDTICVQERKVRGSNVEDEILN
jgi:hypothetical protein